MYVSLYLNICISYIIFGTIQGMWQRQLKQHITNRYPMKIHKANWFQKGFSRWVAKRNEAGKEICRHVRHPWWTNPVFVGYLIPIQGAENPVELSNNLGFPSYDSSAGIIFSYFFRVYLQRHRHSIYLWSYYDVTYPFRLKWKLRVVTRWPWRTSPWSWHILRALNGMREPMWNKQQNFTRNYIQYQDFYHDFTR